MQLSIEQSKPKVLFADSVSVSSTILYPKAKIYQTIEVKREIKEVSEKVVSLLEEANSLVEESTSKNLVVELNDKAT